MVKSWNVLYSLCKINIKSHTECCVHSMIQSKEVCTVPFPYNENYTCRTPTKFSSALVVVRGQTSCVENQCPIS